MTDLEMMERAAKAAGMEVHRGDGWQADMLFRSIQRPSSPLVANVQWNPLEDDGDALRLAWKLRMNIEPQTTMGGKPTGFNVWPAGRGDCGATEDGNAPDAMRRAIVRAAACLAK